MKQCCCLVNREFCIKCSAIVYSSLAVVNSVANHTYHCCSTAFLDSYHPVHSMIKKKYGSQISERDCRQKLEHLLKFIIKSIVDRSSVSAALGEGSYIVCRLRAHINFEHSPISGCFSFLNLSLSFNCRDVAKARKNCVCVWHRSTAFN